jgi:hypothetical protein
MTTATSGASERRSVHRFEYLIYCLFAADNDVRVGCLCLPEVGIGVLI